MEGEEKGAIVLPLNSTGVLLNLMPYMILLFVLTFVTESDSDSLSS